MADKKTTMGDAEFHQDVKVEVFDQPVKMEVYDYEQEVAKVNAMEQKVVKMEASEEKDVKMEVESVEWEQYVHEYDDAGSKKDSGSADAPGRDEDRKMFVGGLSWVTTDKDLREHFGKYGDIESINVKTDVTTGRSRGFAFIVFSTVDAIDKVLLTENHVINNKKVDPKKAKARHGKIFVGGLTPELSETDIKDFFGQHGAILEVQMLFDKQKNQRKNFCFITFECEQVATDLLKTPKQTIKDKEVDVKAVVPKPEIIRAWMRGGPRGRRGARGRWGAARSYYDYHYYGNGFDVYQGYGLSHGYISYGEPGFRGGKMKGRGGQQVKRLQPY